MIKLCVLLVLAAVAGASVSRAATPPAAPLGAAATAAMQVLKANCLSCHNAEKSKGGLQLATRELALKGGDEGVVLVPGKPEESPLVKSLQADADPHMPPKKQLSARQIALLQDWVRHGAPWDEAALNAPIPEEPPVALRALPAAYQPVMAVALSKDARRLAVGRGGTITIFDVGQTNRPVIGTLTGPLDAVQSLAWSADGKLLAAGEYRRIWLWDAATLAPVAEWTNNLAGRITALEFTPDSASLLAADGRAAQESVVHLWDVKASKLAATWTAHKDTIFGLRISPDGKWVATASADKLAKVWEIASQKEIAKFEGHLAHLLAVSFNHDATLLATGSADKEIKIWDLKTKEKKINLNTRAGVTGLAWSADGKTLVSVSEEGTPKVFTEFQNHAGGERSRGAQEKVLAGVNDVLYAVASADGKAIYAGCHDGSVYLWADGKAPVALNFTPETKQAAKDP